MKGGIEPRLITLKSQNDTQFTICATGVDVSIDCCFLYILIDRCLVQSTVSNLFPNQWRCLKLYFLLPVCLICRCVFWLAILLSNSSLCFLTCFNVFWIVVVFSELLFSFLDLHLRLLFCLQNSDLFCTSQPPYIPPWNAHFRVELLAVASFFRETAMYTTWFLKICEHMLFLGFRRDKNLRIAPFKVLNFTWHFDCFKVVQS